jgi:hypothetical protein
VSRIQVLLYWVGVVAAVACLALSLVRFAYSGIPLPIFAGILSIAAFIGAEYTDADFETLVADDPLPTLQPEA